jgi:hypothetical protein
MSAQVHSAEQFKVVAPAGPFPQTDFVDISEPMELSVPAEVSTRHLWIAAGAYYQGSNTDHWLIQGNLTFWLAGKQVGKLEFSDASADIFAGEMVLAPRTLLRISPNATGSTQPALRFQVLSGGGLFRDNLDIACMTVQVQCDRIKYHVEKSYTFTGNNFFLIGLRCVSHP